MKTLVMILCLAGLAPAEGNGPETGRDPAANTYTLVRSDANISVYSKWIPLNEKVSTRKVKAVFSCACDPSDVLRVISDDRAVTDWMSNVAAFDRLKNLNDREWYAYIRYGLPWPLDDHDCIVRYRVEDSDTSRFVRVLVTGEPGYLPENRGVSRIPHLECEWLVYRTGDHRVLVEYSQYSRQEPKYPRKIADPLVQKALIRSLSSFRAIAERN